MGFVEGSSPIAICCWERSLTASSPSLGLHGYNSVDRASEIMCVKAIGVELIEFLVDRGVEYSVVALSFDKHDFVRVLENSGFGALDDFYMMVCPLDRDFEPSEILSFQEVSRGEMCYFIELAHSFMQGSPDVTLTIALQYFLKLLYCLFDLGHAATIGNITIFSFLFTVLIFLELRLLVWACFG